MPISLSTKASKSILLNSFEFRGDNLMLMQWGAGEVRQEYGDPTKL